MTPRIDYGPQMLALFLQAHVMRVGTLAAERPLTERDRDVGYRLAAKAERRRIIDRSGTKTENFDRAIKGLKITDDARRALWRALGINPDIHNQGEVRK